MAKFDKEKFKRLSEEYFTFAGPEAEAALAQWLQNMASMLQDALGELQEDPKCGLLDFFIQPLSLKIPDDIRDKFPPSYIYISALPLILNSPGVNTLAAIAGIGKQRGLVQEPLLQQIAEVIQRNLVLKDNEKMAALNIFSYGSEEIKKEEKRRGREAHSDSTLPPPLPPQRTAVVVQQPLSSAYITSETKGEHPQTLKQCFVLLQHLFIEHIAGIKKEREILKILKVLPAIDQECLKRFTEEKREIFGDTVQPPTFLCYLLSQSSDLDLLDEIQKLLQTWKQIEVWEEKNTKSTVQAVLNNSAFRERSAMIADILKPSQAATPQRVEDKRSVTDEKDVSAVNGKPTAPPPATDTKPLTWFEHLEEHWRRYLAFAFVTAIMLALCFSPAFAVGFLPAVLLSVTPGVTGGTLPIIAGVVVSVAAGVVAALPDYVFSAVVWCGAMALKALCFLGWGLALLTDRSVDAMEYAKKNIRTHTFSAIGAGILGVVGFVIAALPTLVVASLVEVGELVRSVRWLHGKIMNMYEGIRENVFRQKHVERLIPRPQAEGFIVDAENNGFWNAIVRREKGYANELDPRSSNNSPRL